MTRGFVVLAQNTDKINYVGCAETLAKSIRRTMPHASITLVSDSVEHSKYFDKVIALPYGDQSPNSEWKLINDWQVYEASPYDETIKLEADLFIPKSIDYWWDILSLKDIVISTTIRDFNQSISTERFYRKFIDYNKLPDCYNAITYFKKSDTAEKFFSLVKLGFENWEEYKSILQCKQNEEATTDWVYALASHIIGEDKTTIPSFTAMSMVHMKQMINGTLTENWTDELVYEILPNTLRVNSIPQKYPFHYHIKEFHKELDKVYE